ncbi:MAG: hypothetical protein IT211_04510 [Armatimonadetes bacterium]|nr:hypothetical protein [Armatimonadota bacterium]
MNALILHPDTANRRQRIAAYRHELATLFAERLELNFELLPRLRQTFAELFGDLERAIQERTLEMSERRRMVELFSIKLDRGQRVDARMVELVMKAVHNEFGRVRKRMRHEMDTNGLPNGGFRIHKRRAATAADTPPREAAQELQRLYRQLAKRLHPDMQRGSDEVTAICWDVIQQGYHHGDLAMLRTVANVLEATNGVCAPLASSAEMLAADERQLLAALKAERRVVGAMKSQEPYSIREGLADQQWIAERRQQMEQELAAIEVEIAKCDRFLTPVLSVAHNINSPEIVQTIWSDFVETMYVNNR